MMNLRLIVLAAGACLVPISVHAQVVSTSNYIPVASSVTEGRYSCTDSKGQEVDATIRYSLRRAAGSAAVGEVESLRVGEGNSDADEAGIVNSAINGRGVEGVSVSCHADGSMRFILKLWDPGMASAGGEGQWLTVVYRPDSGIEVAP